MTIGVIWLQHSAITAAPNRGRDALPAQLARPRPLLLALALALTAFVRYAAEHRRLVKDEIEAEAVEAALVHQPSFLLYGGGIAVGVLFPTVGVALYLAIPGRTIRRLLSRT